MRLKTTKYDSSSCSRTYPTTCTKSKAHSSVFPGSDKAYLLVCFAVWVYFSVQWYCLVLSGCIYWFDLDAFTGLWEQFGCIYRSFNEFLGPHPGFFSVSTWLTRPYRYFFTFFFFNTVPKRVFMAGIPQHIFVKQNSTKYHNVNDK